MNESFVFEDIGVEPELPKPPPKSPWEFSGYSRTVAEEHAKRNTTSIDDKISSQRSHRRLPDREDEECYRASKIDEEKIIRVQNSKKIENKKQEVQNSKIDVKRIEKKNVKSDEIEDDMPLQKDEEKNKDVRVNKKRKVKNKKKEEEDNEKRKVTDIEEEEEENSDDVRVAETGHWDGESDESEEEAAEAAKVEQSVRKANKVLKSGINGKKSFFSTAEGASFNANSFAELNLSRPLLRACESLGYRKPTPIQAACIPIALTGRDICGSAITGSGKTAAFGLPVLERLLYRPKRIPAIRVLILTPTRELAVQIHSMVEKLGQFTDIRCCLVVGGLSMKNQEVQLRSRPDIVVATPGRMIDHLRNSQSVGLEDLAVLIFDEADRLLELGFSSEVEELVKGCPKRRQTMLFSATMTSGVDELIKLSLTSPVRLSADPLTKRPTALTEEVIKIRPAQEAKQEALLLALCTRSFTNKVIIFSGTKKEAHRLKILFGLSNLKAAELHGNLTQAQRLEALEKFRKQEVDFLIATDVAARGLDIIGVQTVINFACPRDITSYVHRVGRTARAGKTGCAITFMTERDRKLLKSMARRAGSRLLSRRVADQSVDYWFGRIEEMEEDVNAIMLEEREEMILRKAEMEANKAQNMSEHRDEIYSRPKRTWFESDKEKKVLAKASKDLKESDGSDKKKVTSVKEADKLERREKRKHENERNLPRKQRRKLQAAREMLEEDADNNPDKEQGSLKDKVQKAGKSLVEIGYRRAKSAKAAEKARETGKFVKTNNSKPKGQREKGRTKEMEDLFKNEMSSKKQKNSATGLHIGKKQSKRAFKSKSRYKRRK